MRLLSYLFRDLKVTLACLATYLLRRIGRGGKREEADRKLRVSMHAGSLGEQNGRKEFTGIGRYVDELVTGLLQLSPEIALRVYTEGNYPRPEAGERYVNIPCRKRTLFATRMAGDIAGGAVDLVHLTDTDSYFSHLLPALLAPVAAVTVHDVTPLVWPGYMPTWRKALYRSVLRRACRKCAVVFVNSEYTRQDLQRVTGMECANVVVTPLGVDPRFAPSEDAALLQSVRKKYALPEKFLLTVGRSAPHKNLETLVRAVKSLRDSGLEVGLMIVGPKDFRSGTRGLEAVIQEVEGAAWVCWPGFVDDEDLPALYNAAQAFAFPSLYEGFGLPVLEAMASGTPVVCSDSTSLPEVAGDAALLVDAARPEALTAALRRVLTDPALCANLRERGKLRAAKFRWETTARLTLDAYKRVLLRKEAKRE